MVLFRRCCRGISLKSLPDSKRFPGPLAMQGCATATVQPLRVADRALPALAAARLREIPGSWIGRSRCRIVPRTRQRRRRVFEPIYTDAVEVAVIGDANRREEVGLDVEDLAQ